jgi:hypothetical protein
MRTMKHFVTVHVCDFETMGTVMKTLETDGRIEIVDYGPIAPAARRKNGYAHKRSSPIKSPDGLRHVDLVFAEIKKRGEIQTKDADRVLVAMGGKPNGSARLFDLKNMGMVDRVDQTTWKTTDKGKATPVDKLGTTPSIYK